MDLNSYATRRAELERERDAAQLLLQEATERLQDLPPAPAEQLPPDADPGDESDGHPGLDNPTGQPATAPAARLSRGQQRKVRRLTQIAAKG